MGKPYSKDLRERAVRARDQGKTYDDIAEDLGVGRATVNRWLRRYRERGTVEAEPMGGAHNVVLDEAALEELRRLVEEKPDRTLDELAGLLEPVVKTRPGLATVVRGLAKLGLRRKKKSVVASERATKRVMTLRQQFEGRQADFDSRRLVFIDEAGAEIGMTRTHGRAPKGVPLIEHVPRNRGTVVTMIGALTICGLEAVMTVEGGTSADVFLAFIQHVLAPKVGPDDIIVLDNLAAHRTARVRAALDELGVKVVFLPPYSPDLNPIENCWSKLKQQLRTAKARTRAALERAIAEAAEQVTPMDCAGWFDNCGYAVST